MSDAQNYDATKKDQQGRLMLRLDGEVWRVLPGYDTDANSINCRPATPERDQKAIEVGVELIQTPFGGSPYHEVEKVR